MPGNRGKMRMMFISPADPTDLTDPDDPDDPTDPTEPTDPMHPITSNNPSCPIKPSYNLISIFAN
jgi:hypothetical protein